MKLMFLASKKEALNLLLGQAYHTTYAKSATINSLGLQYPDPTHFPSVSFMAPLCTVAAMGHVSSSQAEGGGNWITNQGLITGHF